MRKTPLLRSYSATTRVLAPLLPFWLKRRVDKGKEDPARINERDGITNTPRPDGHVVWMHAASVGESQMLMPLIKLLRQERPDCSVLITTGTLTSAHLLEDDLPDNVIHQYAPADHPKAVQNFLDHWQPSMALFAESELWPNMLMQSKARNIPLALINARMSSQSIQRWAKMGKKSGQTLLGYFDLILAADKTTADGLAWLTGRDIDSVGNLKDAAPTLNVDTEKLKKLKKALGRRPVWCAASTHEGEEELIIDAALEIKKKKPTALLILAPRHPERAKHVKNLCEKAGLKTLRYSSHRLPTKETHVFLVDTMGKMGLVYRLGKISFIGGSLLKGLSGHNPLEPARLGSAVMTGSHIASFADTYMALFSYGGATRIHSPDALAPTILKLFSNTELRNTQTKAALQYAQSRDNVLAYVWDALSPLLPQEEVT